MAEAGGMLRHIVMFRMKEFAEDADGRQNMQRLKAQLEGLKDIIEEIKLFEVGINISDGNVGCDLVLYSEFEGLDDLHRYQAHPDHIKVADFVGKVCRDRLVADYTV